MASPARLWHRQKPHGGAGDHAHEGGKSTHFLQWLRDSRVAILSDDTPLVSRMGKLRPFPIRVGVEHLSPDVRAMVQGDDMIYQLQREHYGNKVLISLRGLVNPIGGEYRRVVLMRGIRTNNTECLIRQSSKWGMLGELLKYQVVGWGVPMILEYFWEDGLIDFCKKSWIALSRLGAAVFLLLRSKTYTVFLGADPQRNVQVMRERFWSHERSF